MTRRSPTEAVAVASATAAALAVVVGLAAPASGTVYETPGREVAVGTEGEDVWARHLAVSNGGDVDTWQGAGATTTGSARGYVAASGTGCAYSSWLLGASVTGCATSLLVAGSVLGPIVDHPTSNGSAQYGVSGTGCVGASELAVSGTSCADGPVAASGAGHAQGRGDQGTGLFTSVPGAAASGTGDASGGWVSVAGGDATADSASVWNGIANTGATVPGIAVAGGDATADGGLVAVSATGEAEGALVNIAPLDDAGRR